MKRQWSSIFLTPSGRNHDIVGSSSFGLKAQTDWNALSSRSPEKNESVTEREHAHMLIRAPRAVPFLSPFQKLNKLNTMKGRWRSDCKWRYIFSIPTRYKHNTVCWFRYELMVVLLGHSSVNRRWSFEDGCGEFGYVCSVRLWVSRQLFVPEWPPIGRQGQTCAKIWRGCGTFCYCFRILNYWPPMLLFDQKMRM